MPISSIADSLRAPIIQPQVRSLTGTLASQVIRNYLPLNRGGTEKDLDTHGALRGEWPGLTPIMVDPQRWKRGNAITDAVFMIASFKGEG
jgi:hypothetical protein